eukprot:3534555-Pyramimonas_sp.AAC.1
MEVGEVVQLEAPCCCEPLPKLQVGALPGHAKAEHGLDDVARAFGVREGPEKGPGLSYHEHHDDQQGAGLPGAQGRSSAPFSLSRSSGSLCPARSDQARMPMPGRALRRQQLRVDALHAWGTFRSSPFG